MADVFTFVLLLMLLTFIGMIWYRYRHEIAKFLKDKNYGSTWYPKRETILKRKIEDANAELQWLAERQLDEEVKKGGGD